MKPDLINRTLAAQDAHAEQLAAKANVVAVATGYRQKGGRVTKEICVQVFVRRKVAAHQLAAEALVPKTVSTPDGAVATDVIELPIPEAQQDTTRYRPVPGGCSIGPEATVSAGTLGGFACDDTDSTIVQLSNNHVISGLDAMPALRRIVQPGRLDGGVLPGDVIGALKRHVVVNTVPNVAGANPAASVVDAAIGTVTVARTDQIRQLDVPAIYELQAPALGMNVQKRGRTTRLTTNGRITSINVTTLITYRNQTRLGRVQNSFIITSTNGAVFSAAGDSGSLILNQARGELNGTFPVVGLLFAGGTNNAGTPITIANDINAVFGALDLETVCTCVARAIIRAIFGSEGAEGRDASGLLRAKERQLRRFREGLAQSGAFGRAFAGLVTREAARVGHVLFTDDDAFKLLVKALRPLVTKADAADVLKTKLDAETAAALVAFSTRVARQAPPLKGQMALARAAVGALQGLTIGRLLKATRVRLER
jgi:hypothetical protein